MTDANAQPELPDRDVVRTRRIEVVDASERVRIEIGELRFPGPNEVRGFGITLRGPNGSVRADLTEDAGGVQLNFLSSGNPVLVMGAQDTETLMLDRGGDDLVYLPAGHPGNEVSDAGSYLIFDTCHARPELGWRLYPDGEVETVGPDQCPAVVASTEADGLGDGAANEDDDPGAHPANTS